MTQAFGQHLIVDASGCNSRISNRDAIATFARELVEAIDMKAYGDPWIEHFGHDLPKASGFTLVQLIETSNITGHFCDHTGEAYLDIFSCKSFDVDVALSVIDRHFAPAERSIHSLVRQAPKVEAKLAS